jgi:hypothetical protein
MRKPLFKIHYVFGEGVWKDQGKGVYIAYSVEEFKEYLYMVIHTRGRRFSKIEVM